MNDLPDTRASLLVQICDPTNREAWETFSQVYRPVVYRVATVRGLQDADAQDLAQQVLMSVASAIGRWQQSGSTGQFRHWLLRVAKNATLNAITRQPRDRATGSSSVWDLLNDIPHPDSATSQQIDLEYERQVYLQVAKQVRNKIRAETWSAFELTVIDGVSIEAAAKRLSKSVGTIYAARSRVMRRLRDSLSEWKRDHDPAD